MLNSPEAIVPEDNHVVKCLNLESNICSFLIKDSYTGFNFMLGLLSRLSEFNMETHSFNHFILKYYSLLFRYYSWVW